MLTWENTWKDIQDSGATVAVIPIGSTEQHGTNLPLASDCIITAKVAEVLAEKLGAYLVPLIPIGTSREHLSFRGTITLTEETLKGIVADITDSLVNTGFKTIIIVSLHGGNRVLWSDFIPQLNGKYPDVTVVTAELRHAWFESHELTNLKTTGEMHAGECEASLVASLRPDLIGPAPVDFSNPRERLEGIRLDSFGFPLDVRELSPSGALGEPSKATKEKGDSFWDVFLKIAVEDVKKQAKFKIRDRH